jgi:hypothetical protein
MRTAAELQDQASSSADPDRLGAGPSAEAGSAAGRRPPARLASAPVLDVSLTAPLSAEPSTSGSSSSDGQPALPLLPASRNAVLSSALVTGFWMAALALFVRNYALLNSAKSMGTDPAAVAALLDWGLFSSGYGLGSPAGQALVAIGAAAAVTGARFALMGAWPELQEATERSNKQASGLAAGSWLCCARHCCRGQDASQSCARQGFSQGR